MRLERQRRRTWRNGLLVFEELVIGTAATCAEAAYGPCSRRTVVTAERLLQSSSVLSRQRHTGVSLAHHALVIGFQRCLYVVADLEQIVRVVLLKFPSALMDSLRGVFTQVVDNSWAGFKQGHYSPRTSTGKHSHGITVGSACESLGLWRALEQRCCSLRPTMPEPQPTTTPTTQTTTASTAR